MKISKYWPVAVISLAAVALGANFLMVYLAVTDPGFGVEPDYYQKALKWDGHMAQQQANSDLGWSFEFDVSKQKNPDGTLEVRAVVMDDAGVTIDNATVELTTFHNAQSSYPLQAKLASRGEGVYSATLPFRRPGLWEFRFLLQRGETRFTNTVVREVAWRR